ncbi:MAG: S9 family peptidase [Novosphingobium sp.]|uniref:prolyl oligopeptidase family serine peptidase n=1 Tax=Novosphingobium sp. TaxID=1874826 RepID=UPI002612A89A|nr:prolyl oligopeptidase family serine peptidase [Novosphingobium sp.]MCP5385365.1 S9 family peptidase [Novosphingobium sp.]
MASRGRAQAAALLLAAALLGGAVGGPAPAYPETRRDPLSETLFGEPVADPYRWLEADLRSDPAVAEWALRQDAVTRAYLAGLPQRAWFEQRLRALMDYDRFGLPVKAGQRYFYTRNTGRMNQPQLFVRRGLSGKPRLLLDPNAWSVDGTSALDTWKPSPNGRTLLYSVQDAGSDWRTLRMIDVATGRALADELRWVKFSSLTWVDETGFLYSRFPAPDRGGEFLARNFDQAIWFHRLGTPQQADELVYATPGHREYRHRAEVTSDRRYAVIVSNAAGDEGAEIHVVDLAHRRRDGWAVRGLAEGFDHDWKLIDGFGSRLWFVTDWSAARGRVVGVDLAAPVPTWSELVPEQRQRLQAGRVVGRKLILSYQDDGASRALVFDLRGRPAQLLSLNLLGTASGFFGKPGDPETFYSFTSFNQPPAIYRYDLDSGVVTPFAVPEPAFDANGLVTEQRSYTSRDGTQVPLLIVRRRDVAAAGKPVPTLLYGYGGFDIALHPGFSATRLAWIEAGGAFAMAGLRGGGEFGKDWHDAGRRANKQNVFDDFIAAGEYLIAQGIAKKDGLAIQGASNGGLLVGAVINQRPDLFAAANPAAGVMDMLRFDRFTAGRFWLDDYGDPGKEADFKVLRSYSPYHNIRAGADYPSVLVTTGDTDDRVVPAHSFKYVAALQAAGGGARPRLLRIESRAGHGSGKPAEKQIDEGADVLAFLAYWTGLNPD